MICWGGQIVDIAEDEALRPDEGVKSIVRAIALIALKSASVECSIHVTGRAFKGRSPGIGGEELQAMAKAMVQTDAQGVIPGCAHAFDCACSRRIKALNRLAQRKVGKSVVILTVDRRYGGIHCLIESADLNQLRSARAVVADVKHCVSREGCLDIRPSSSQFPFRIRCAGPPALRGLADIQPLSQKWALRVAVACDSDLCSQRPDSGC